MLVVLFIIWQSQIWLWYIRRQPEVHVSERWKLLWDLLWIWTLYYEFDENLENYASLSGQQIKKTPTALASYSKTNQTIKKGEIMNKEWYTDVFVQHWLYKTLAAQV